MLKIFLIVALFSAFAMAWMESDQDEDTNERFDEELSSAGETVVEFLQKFETLSASTADIGTFMGTLSLGAYSLLKLGFPVGSLLASALNIATKPESDEYKALIQLQKKMEEKFENIETTIRVATKVISLAAQLHDYQNNVRVPMKSIRDIMNKFWNPAIPKTPADVQDFKGICYRDRRGTPLTILHYLHAHLYDHCVTGLTPDQVSHLSIFGPLINKIRMQIKNELEIEKFESFKPDLLIWFSKIENHRAETVLKKMTDSIRIVQIFDSADDALTMIMKIFQENGIEEPEKNSLGCLLQDIITGKNFHRQEIEELLNIIRYDIIELLVFGSMCSNITFDGEKATMDWYFKILAKDAIQIIDNMEPYVSSELLKSFPQIEIGVAKSKIDAMKLTQPVTDNATIFEVMSKVFGELEEYGEKKYTKTGFVSTNLSNDTNSLVRCNTVNCFFIYDYNSLNILVTKYDFTTEEVKASQAWDWLYSRAPPHDRSLADMLWTHIDVNYNINSLSVLLGNFEAAEHLSLTDNNLYRNLAVLRANGGGTGMCGITTASTYYQMGAFASSASVNYYYDGTFFRQCESYMIVFFI